jgi:methionine-rich copper-binding protein CopC
LRSFTAPAPSSSVLNERDTIVWSHNLVMQASDFMQGRLTDLRVELPTSQLSAGEYLVRVRVVAPGHQTERRLIFRVSPS